MSIMVSIEHMIRVLIDFYVFLLVLNAILSYIPSIQKYEWVLYFKKVSDYTCRPIQQYLPKDLPVDVSPLVVIVLLNLIKVLW